MGCMGQPAGSGLAHRELCASASPPLLPGTPEHSCMEPFAVSLCPHSPRAGVERGLGADPSA